MLIATSAAPSLGDNHALSLSVEVEHLLAGRVVIHDGPDRDLEHHVFAAHAGAVRAFAVASAVGLVLGVIAKVDEGVVLLGGLHDDVTTHTTVAAAGTSAGHELLAAEGYASVAAVSRFHADLCLIYEHFF